MEQFKVGGRELALVFTLAVMDDLEKAMGHPINLEDIKETVLEATKDRHKLITMLAIMAREGAALDNQTSDIDEAWLARRMKPSDILRARLAVIEAVTEGMSMETAEGDSDEERDLVLEEIKKKRATDA